MYMTATLNGWGTLKIIHPYSGTENIMSAVHLNLPGYGGKFKTFKAGEYHNQRGQKGSRRDTGGPDGRGKHPGK